MLYRPTTLERRIYDSEVRLLGGLLRSPQRLSRFAARLRPLDFYDYRHQLIWAAVLSLHRRGDPVTVNTVLAELADDARDDDAGGRGFLTWLAELAPVSQNPLAAERSNRRQARPPRNANRSP